MQTQTQEKTKRIRLTAEEIQKLPPEYQHEIKGAIHVLEIQREQQKESKSA